ncbi:MAG: A24 family peptidase [Planctomycetota bacterium]
MVDSNHLRLGALVMVLVAATWADLARRKIYNPITYAGMGLGLGLAAGDALFSKSVNPALSALVGMALGLGVFAIPYFLGWLGGGDVKLMGAIGSLVAPVYGPFFLMRVIFYSSLAGCCMALVVLIWEGRFLAGLKRAMWPFARPKAPPPGEPGTTTIPYGVAIVVGTVTTIVLTTLVKKP